MPPQAHIVPPSDYPAVLRRVDIPDFLRLITSEETARRMNAALAGRKVEFAEAVRQAAQRLQEATKTGDLDCIYAEAHEIRGLAQTGGLTASGMIADRLCHYLQNSRGPGRIDHGLVGLHVGAIARAAFAEDEATRLGLAVAGELAALVARKLGKSLPHTG